MDAVGKFLKYFLIFFLGFFAIGAFQMHRQKQTSLYAQTFVVRHLQPVQTRSQTLLVLRVGGRDYWAIDVQSNDAYFVDGNSILATLGTESSAASSEIETSAAVFLVGAGGWSVKDVLQSLASAEEGTHGFAQALGAVLGTVAGYRFGAWVVYRQPPSMSQENIQYVLNNKNLYPTIKRLVWLRLWHEIPKWDQDHHHPDPRSIKRARSELLAVDWVSGSTTAKARTVGTDLNSTDFRFLLRYRSPDIQIDPVSVPPNSRPQADG